MDEKEYLEKFKSDEKSEIDSKHLEAFKLAIDTRKFEIELYWKRATYFWAFIAVTFAGYGFSLRLPKDERDFIGFFLCCFGFILSFSWFFANRGSKQWQENWEHHVDHLEDKVTGPIYKIVLRRSKPEGCYQWLGFIFTGPSKHSVSKINQLVSLYIAFMWLILVYHSQESWNIFLWPTIEKSILTLTILAGLGIAFGARTFSGNHTHYADERESNIVEKQG